MERFRRAFKLWFAWDPERIEDYLEIMSMQGWHMVYADGWLVSFMFERGEPKRIRYCLDYQWKDKAEYRQLFVDGGWQLLQSSMGWYVWRKEYSGERPGIYTDTDSLMARNRSILLMIGGVFLTQVPVIILNVNNLIRLAKAGVEYFVLLAAFLAAVYSLLVYCMIKLSLSIRKMKRKKRIQGT